MTAEKASPELSARMASKLGPSNGSITKYVIASLPFLFVLIYFLYSAYTRPQQPFYSLPIYVDDDTAIKEAAEASGSLMPLMDMVCVCLAFFVMWASLAFYMLFYVRKRASLVKTYLEKGEETLGNIVYDARTWCFGFRHYGYVTYGHPQKPQVASIRKRVRLMIPCTRELETILVLKGKPFSGQPKDDLEMEQIQEWRGFNHNLAVGLFAVFWALICLAVPIFILEQLRVLKSRLDAMGLYDHYDNASLGLIVYLSWIATTVIVIFLISGLSWFLHRRWVVQKGDLTGAEDVRAVRPIDASDVVETNYYACSELA